MVIVATYHERHQMSARNSWEFWKAIDSCDRDSVAALLRSGEPLGNVFEDGCTPLTMAAGKLGGGPILELLIVAGADVNIVDANGHSSLMRAAQVGNAKAVSLLAARGAALDAANGEGETALTYAIVWEQPEVIATLLKLGASVNSPLEPWLPLHYAADGGNPEIVSLLIKAGALTDAKDPYGRDPLDLAVSRKHHEVAQLLRMKG